MSIYNVSRIMVSLLFIPTLINAQAARPLAANVVQQTSSVSSLDHRISLDLTNVPLSRAVDEISAQAGIRIVYVKEQLASRQRVSLRSESITARNALEQIIRNTGLELSSYGGALAIVERSKASGKKLGQGTISGKVIDAKTGRGISGVTVSIDGDARGTSTDEDGSYRLTGISSGTHVLTVRLLGYAKQTKSVTVGESAGVVILSVDFKLEPTANVLDQVVVTGTVAATELKAVPNAMTIVTAKQIEERGITRLEQLFRGEVPGLYAVNFMGSAVTDNYGQVALFSRGATSINNGFSSGSTGINSSGALTNNMKMYVDGVQLSDSGLRFLGQIDPKSIERIEILTGPQASTVYGAGAINGVMQIFTKRGTTRRPQFALSFQSGMAESNYRKGLELNNYITNASLSGLEGRISYRLGTSWNHDASWLAGQQTNVFGADGSTHISIGSKITGTASARWSRRFSLMKGNPVGKTTPLGSLLTDGVQRFDFTVAPVHETAFTGSQGGGLELNYTQFPWWSHHLTVGFDGNSTSRYQPGPKYSNIGDTSLSLFDRPGRNTSQAYNSTMQLPMLSLASLNLTFGGDHTRSDMNNLGWFAGKTTGLLFTVPADNGGNIQAYQSKPNRHSGTYVNGRLGIKDALFFTYGVRVDWDPAYGDDANVTPGKYGATFNQNFGPVTAKFRGSYGSSVRAPKRGLTQGFLVGANQTQDIQAFGVYYTTLPNPELVPEDQQGGEGGMDLYFGNRGSLSVTRYNQTVDNLIEGFNADSVRTLTTSAFNQNFCDFRGPFNIIFDAEGYCYKYQRQNLNIGSIRNQGWELTSTMNLGPMRTHGTYSWTKSRVIGITPKYRNRLPNFASANFQVGAPFNYMPEHTWAFGMSYDYPRGTISLDLDGHGTNLVPINNTILGITTSANNRFTYTRERMSLPSGVKSIAVPGYGNAYLTANHRFSSRINATLHVDNLTNHYANDYNASFPTQGRTTRLGANLTW